MLRITVSSYAEAKDCPLRNVLDKLGDKWSLLVLVALEDGPVRFNPLRKLIGDISQRVLTGKLRNLERDGYVKRKVLPTKPPSVEYSLTALGQSALGPVLQLMQWSLESHAEVRRSRTVFDRDAKQPAE